MQSTSVKPRPAMSSHNSTLEPAGGIGQRRVPRHRARRAVIAQKRNRRAGRMRNHQCERRTAAQNADCHRKTFGEQRGLQRFNPVIELLVREGKTGLFITLVEIAQRVWESRRLEARRASADSAAVAAFVFSCKEF